MTSFHNDGFDGAIRVPPQDISAEQATLGSMLMEASAADRVIGMLDDSDFYREAHRAIFRAMKSCHNRGEPIDLITVGAALRSTAELGECGGPEYLTSLLGEVPTVAHVVIYAKTVADKSRLRKLIIAGSEIMGQGYDNPGDPQGAIEQAHDKLLRLVDPGRSGAGARHTTETVELVGAAQEVWISDEINPGNRPNFGLPELDAYVGGLRIPSLSVIMGFKGFGKSTFCAQVVHQWAYLHQEPTAWFTTGEETREDSIRRIAGINSGIDFSPMGVRDACRRDEAGFRREVADAVEEASRANVWINDKPITWGEFSSQVRTLVREQNVRLVVLDYLERIADQEDDDKVAAMQRIGRSAQRMQSELGICILTGSQVTEGKEGQTMARYSAQLENDATVLIRVDGSGGGTQEDRRSDDKKVAIVRAAKFGPTGGRFTMTRLPNRFVEVADENRVEEPREVREYDDAGY